MLILCILPVFMASQHEHYVTQNKKECFKGLVVVSRDLVVLLNTL